MLQTLVLNADFRPLSVFPLSLKPWQEAVKNVYEDTVNVVAEYDRVARSPSVTMRIPSVVALRQYLPEVHDGDSLRLEVNTDHSAVFLYNGKPIVTFTDTEFVNAFVGIWLSEKTDNLTLRRQLLGLQK